MKSSSQARVRPDIPAFANRKLAHRRGSERAPSFGCGWSLRLAPSEAVRPSLAKNPLVDHPEKKAGLRPVSGDVSTEVNFALVKLGPGIRAYGRNYIGNGLAGPPARLSCVDLISGFGVPFFTVNDRLFHLWRESSPAAFAKGDFFRNC